MTRTSDVPATSLDFQALFMATAIPTLLLDPALVIVEVNDAYLLTTKRQRDDLIDRNIFEAFPNSPDNANADSLTRIRRSLEHVLHAHVADKISELRYNIPVGNLTDGTFEERYWSPINTPLFDTHGNLVYVIHQAEDITSRVTSNVAIRDSEIRFRALTTATADVVYRMSPDWKYMHELNGRGFLKTTNAWAEYQIEEYVYSEDLDVTRAAIEQAICKKTTFELEHRVLRADGSYGWTYSKAVPILKADGEIREWIGSASNITERKVAEEQLKESSRRKDEFLAMLAHELRNPLAPISSAAQLLQLGTLDEARLRHTSNIIGRHVAHMTELVDELLDVSRVARGVVKLSNEPLDINKVITDAVEQVASLMQSRRHHLEIRLCSEVASVLGDKKRLVQVVVNLLNNAAKFTPEGGKLLLKTDLVESQLRLEVTDNGIGMTPGTVIHAFELFSQAERSSDRSLGGLGLGLALVKSLVELHGGTVRCKSRGLNKGSTFTIYLPQLLIHDINEESPVSPVLPDEPCTSLRILVVDDNEDAASVLATLLEVWGHEVSVEHRPTQALERARHVTPQVCLLDIGLPEMDGYELAQRLRAQPETAATVMIALTGYSQDVDRAQSTGNGFQHHLIKPVDIDKLRSILAEIVEGKRSP